MNGSDPGCCQHGDHQLDCHGHIACNPIALLDSLGFVNIGQLTDLGSKFIVADLSILERFARLAVIRIIFDCR